MRTFIYIIFCKFPFFAQGKFLKRVCSVNYFQRMGIFMKNTDYFSLLASNRGDAVSRSYIKCEKLFNYIEFVRYESAK